MIETDHPLVHQLAAAWNTHDIETITSLYSPDFVEIDVAQAAPLHGKENLYRMVHRYLAAFPDLQLAIDACVTQGSRVAAFWTLRGSHQGTLMNIPPTGRQVSVRGVSLLTLDNNLIYQSERIWDVAGLLRTIGLLPEL